MKICRAIFSTNRVEFLVPTLESHKNINFGNHEVTSILIDDYPMGRNDDQIKDICQSYNINRVVLHPKNIGITETWTELWRILAQEDYDYIWHHEDDVIFKYRVDIDSLLQLLHKDRSVCQVILKRNPWYQHELNEPLVTDQDLYHKHYRYNLRDDYFWSLAALYPAWITREPIVETQGCNLGEWPIMQYLNKKYSMKSAILKHNDGSNLVNHIGTYFKGKRVSENEPGWDKFKVFDPNKKYCSKTGVILE